MKTDTVTKLQEAMGALDELRGRRAGLQYKHATEIGELDNAINKQFNKVSSLISLLE